MRMACTPGNTVAQVYGQHRKSAFAKNILNLWLFGGKSLTMDLLPREFRVSNGLGAF
jgi:hypothetical protein